MGESLSKLFIPLHSLPGLYNLPEECLEPTEELLLPTFGGVVQLFFLAGVYGYILFNASNFVAEGSELLLLIPPIAPIVGSVVLPILGAVPDGAIVLFSGLGDIRTAQKQLSVGVGALAGSTIMLLTLPWLLSIVGGRVNIDAGHCTYRKPSGLNADEASRWKKLDKSRPFFGGTGVEPNVQTMRSGARTMIWTCIGYVIIQGSAFAFQGEGDTERIKNEKNYALAGLIFCILAFGYYLWNQIRHAGKNKVVQDVTDDLREQAIRNGMLSLSGAFMDFLKDEQISQRLSPDANSELLHHDVRKERFTTIVKKFYRRYDVNNDGKIDNDELKLLLQDLHVPHDQHHLQRFLEFADHDNSGDIQFEEFVNCMLELVLGKPHSAATDSNYGSTGPRGDTDQSLALLYNSAETGELDARQIDASASETISASQHGTDGDDDEEEEEEIPEDLADLPPQTQQRYIMLRSFKLMGIGTFLILLFSDPMVDVLSEIGDVIGVPAFYISFILAPLASNASELIAAYGYSVRKTSKTITISLSTLEGAAIMNNTFCLGIFLALVYFRGLEWSFSAETISIILVQLLVAIVAYQKIQTMVHAVFVGALFPLSILLVAVLESDWVGLD